MDSIPLFYFQTKVAMIDDFSPYIDGIAYLTGIDLERFESSIDAKNILTQYQAKIAINTMCNRLSIDTAKLLKFMGTNVDNINVLSYKQSHEVIALLNSFTRGEINGGQSVPQNIKGEVIF